MLLCNSSFLSIVSGSPHAVYVTFACFSVISYIDVLKNWPKIAKLLFLCAVQCSSNLLSQAVDTWKEQTNDVFCDFLTGDKVFSFLLKM